MGKRAPSLAKQDAIEVFEGLLKWYDYSDIIVDKPENIKSNLSITEPQWRSAKEQLQQLDYIKLIDHPEGKKAYRVVQILLPEYNNEPIKSSGWYKCFSLQADGTYKEGFHNLHNRELPCSQLPVQEYSSTKKARSANKSTIKLSTPTDTSEVIKVNSTEPTAVQTTERELVRINKQLLFPDGSEHTVTFVEDKIYLTHKNKEYCFSNLNEVKAFWKNSLRPKLDKYQQRRWGRVRYKYKDENHKEVWVWMDTATKIIYNDYGDAIGRKPTFKEKAKGIYEGLATMHKDNKKERKKKELKKQEELADSRAQYNARLSHYVAEARFQQKVNDIASRSSQGWSY